MAHFIIRPAGDNDWSNAVFLSGTPPLIAQDATALGLSLGTDYQIGELGELAQFSVTDRPATMEAPSLAVAVTDITVTLPADPATNGKPLIRYDLRHRAEGGTWTEITDVPGTQTLADLPEAVPHDVQVRAVNDNGPGPWSPSAIATTGTDMTAPAAFANGAWSVVDTGAGGAARITITTLPDDGGSTLTALQSRIDGGPWQTLSGTTAGDYTLSGLIDGTVAQIHLRALNAVGAGPASASKSVTTSAQNAAPMASALSIGPQQANGDVPVTVADITNDAPNSAFILTQTQQPTLSNAQVQAGTDAAGVPAADAGALSLTAAAPTVAATLRDGLDGQYYLYLVLGDADGNISAPIEAGPVTINTTVPAIAADFVTGGAFSTPGTAPTTTVGSLPAGRYAVGIIDVNGTGTLSTTPVLNGVTMTPRGTGLSRNGKTARFYDVTLPGGGSDALSCGLAGWSNRVFFGLWRVDGLSFQSEARADPATTNPTTGSLAFTTGANEVVLSLSGMNAGDGPTVTNQELRVDMAVSNGRSFSAADNLATTGGTPETFEWRYPDGYLSQDVLGVHYA